jgi:hypothetical protein
METAALPFVEFRKIPRLTRECVITEKVDGTNGVICITADGQFLVGSRTRWIVPGDDNYGFAKWAHENKDELMKLGEGTHYGEWWGQGIQRNYGLSEKRFSLFNTHRWSDDAVRPKCCHVVPVLASGMFDTALAQRCVDALRKDGSKAAPGFMKPEGICVFHVAGNLLFKKTLDKDEEWKGKPR